MPFHSYLTLGTMSKSYPSFALDITYKKVKHYHLHTYSTPQILSLTSSANILHSSCKSSITCLLSTNQLAVGFISYEPILNSSSPQINDFSTACLIFQSVELLSFSLILDPRYSISSPFITHLSYMKTGFGKRGGENFLNSQFNMLTI